MRALAGTGVRHSEMHLVTAHKRSRPFPWTEVGPEAVYGLAHAAGLGVDTVDQQLAIVRKKAGIPADAPMGLQKFTVTKEASP